MTSHLICISRDLHMEAAILFCVDTVARDATGKRSKVTLWCHTPQVTGLRVTEHYKGLRVAEHYTGLRVAEHYTSLR